MKTLNKTVLFLLSLILCLNLLACQSSETQKSSLIYKINSTKEFQDLMNQVGENLVIIDLYADWCGPCKILSPVLEQLAQEYKNKVIFYKLNVDELPDIAASFRVTGIPHVVFLKENKLVYYLTGVQPKEKYLEIIKKFSE